MTALRTGTSVMTERAWAESVAQSLASADFADADVERVSGALIDAGIRPGRPRSLHRLFVESVYFAGLKHLGSSGLGENRLGPGRAQDPEREPGQAGSESPSTMSPFGFAHSFAPGLTVFATDGDNDAGKSTVLGIIVWALRGSPPEPTLQADIKSKWLREAAVQFNVDGKSHAVCWTMRNGRAKGAIFTLNSPCPLELQLLRAAGIAAAADEIDGQSSDQGARGEGSDAGADEEIGSAAGHRDVTWPASDMYDSMVNVGTASVFATFSTEDEFHEAVSGLMMNGLDLDPVATWARNPGAVDLDDGSIIEHGWKGLSQALSILDPTQASVLGENKMLVTHLLSVFLGAKWANTVIAARRRIQMIDAQLASARRRRDNDARANSSDLDAMREELGKLRARLETLREVPPLDVVMDVVAQANSDAIAAAQARARTLALAGEYGQAARAHETAEHDLYALTEALATKRFFHSLRPSCCPRCDAEIEKANWEREQEGHCSLCNSEFALQNSEVDSTASDSQVSGDDTAELDRDHEEDQISAQRGQVRGLLDAAEALSDQHDAARQELLERERIAEQSASALALLDQHSSSERFSLETQIARLEGRIEERDGLNKTGAFGDLQDLEFLRAVCDAAMRLATSKRDEEQRETVALVSATITELGAEFGIRNLEQATLKANGHLPVIKGGQKENFGGLNAGERLRLKIALIVGLLRAGSQTGRGRHPGLLIVDDLTTHEIKRDDAATMAKQLSNIETLQFITASTMGPMLASIGGAIDVVMPAAGEVVLF